MHVAVVGTGVLAIALVAVAPGPASTSAAAPPVRVVSVSGTGTATYPDYSETLDRFGVRTTEETDGELSVLVTTTDPRGTVLVDGRPRAQGQPVPVTGLQPGDEVNVQVTDSGGTLNQSFVYLPAGFPALEVTTDEPGQQPGHAFVGLGSFTSDSTYEAVLDANAVPVHVRAGGGADLKAHDGVPGYTSAVGATIEQLDERFQPVRTLRLDGTPEATDFHDSILLPDGGAVLMGYLGGDHHGGSWVDAVIQVLDPSGRATFTWNSKDHVDPAEAHIAPGGDYAHINSLQLLDDGDLIASFRNTSQVMRIATTAHDGYQPGDVVWRLGGVTNQFTFVDDPSAGPCAQHYARLLDDGHLLIFDNGSIDEADDQGNDPFGGQTGDMCPDPGDPTGPGIARPQSRVTEYALDEASHTATLVWTHAVEDRYAPFAGNAQRLENGNTMVGWSQSRDTGDEWATQPIASEATPEGTPVWEVESPAWFSYRVQKFAAPDAAAPVVTVTGPAPGVTVDEHDVVPVAVTCTDRGGSNLDTCSGVRPDGRLDTSRPGPQTLTVIAADRAGNRTVHRLPYTVRARHQPDAQVRRPGRRWVGAALLGRADTQGVTLSTSGRAHRSVRVRVVNDGLVPDRFRVTVRGRRPGVVVRYLVDGRDVTNRVTDGRYRTPSLAPGRSLRMTVRFVIDDRARSGLLTRVVADSVGNPSRTDRIRVDHRRRG